MKALLICILSWGLGTTLMSQTPATDPHWELYMNEEFDGYSDVTELSDRWDAPMWPCSRTALTYLYRLTDDHEYSPYLYFHAFETKFSDHHNYTLESGDGDGALCILPKYEPTPYYARIEKTPWPNYTEMDAYFTMTAGSIKYKELLQNGYFETRIRLPYYVPNDNQYTLYGTYPSFWLYTEVKDNAGNKINKSEIDVYEIFNGKGQISGNLTINSNASLATTNTHCFDLTIDNNNHEERGQMDPDPNLTKHYGDRYVDWTNNVWHTFAVEWNPEYVIFYVDGEQVRKAERFVNKLAPMGVIVSMAMPAATLLFSDTTANYRAFPYPTTSGSLNNPLNLPQMPVILTGVTSNGGSLYNNPGPNLDPNYKYEVDYVKIYKLKKDCNEVINQATYNLSTHVEEVKKSISIGNNSGASNGVSVGDNVQFRASDFVQINGEFEVPLGAQFSMTAHGCPETDARYQCNLTPYINCGFNPNSYDNTVKSIIDINASGCQSTLQNGDECILRARDYINIKEVDSKLFSDLTIKIESCP